MIDWDFIQAKYREILTELKLLNGDSHWHIAAKKITITSHKTKYGMADINGTVHINQAFIGSTAYQLLEATIRHELAHLAVGIQHGHDKFFRAKAQLFKAQFGRHLKPDIQQIHTAIGYKYQLYATVLDGDNKNPIEILFRRVHRKHSKYLNYKPSRFHYLTIQGKKVLRFRYQA